MDCLIRPRSGAARPPPSVSSVISAPTIVASVFLPASCPVCGSVFQKQFKKHKTRMSVPPNRNLAGQHSTKDSEEWRSEWPCRSPHGILLDSRERGFPRLLIGDRCDET